MIYLSAIMKHATWIMLFPNVEISQSERALQIFKPCWLVGNVCRSRAPIEPERDFRACFYVLTFRKDCSRELASSLSGFGCDSLQSDVKSGHWLVQLVKQFDSWRWYPAENGIWKVTPLVESTVKCTPWNRHMRLILLTRFTFNPSME